MGPNGLAIYPSSSGVGSLGTPGAGVPMNILSEVQYHACTIYMSCVYTRCHYKLQVELFIPMVEVAINH